MDPFYELYKDAGFVPIEICTSGIIALLCLIGICLNSSLIFVTIKTNSLHSPCNILIALYALSASFLLSGYTIKFFVFLFGINFIPLRTCYFLIVIPTIGAGFATRLQLCIGLERFAEVSFSIWPVMCSYIDMNYLPEIATHTNVVSFISYIGEFISYALIWMVIWCRKSAVSTKNKKLALSLTILITVSLVFYILGLILTRLVIPKLHLDISIMEYIIWPISHGTLVMAHSSITPILFLCSQEYSKAFRICFPFNRLQSRVASLGFDN